MCKHIKILLCAALALVVLSPFILFRLTRHPIRLPFSNSVFTGTMIEGETIRDILTENGITAEEAHKIAVELKQVFDVRQCNIGDTWELTLTSTGNFVKFVYQSDPLEYHTVSWQANRNCYLAETKKIEAEKKLMTARGKVSRSIYESMISAGINPELIIQFAEVFASKIDFFTDCQNGDEFSLVWESYVHQGKVLKDCQISAARYKNVEADFCAFYFESPDKTAGYYDEKGNSVESAFLRAPLSYRRISSFFSYRRLHPISRVYRPHLGIDYVAPRGTPVSAIGHGKVIFAGWTTNGYGRAVKIRHPNGYISYYGHLSGIGKGLAPGKSVKKGQVIGYVGSTGASTGPHLDFRLNQNGRFINFLKLKMPPSYPLPKKYLPEFEKRKADLLPKLG